jgi:hypothetical protein
MMPVPMSLPGKPMMPSIVNPFAPTQQNWNRALSDGAAAVAEMARNVVARAVMRMQR